MHFLIYYIREDLEITKLNKKDIFNIMMDDFYESYCDGCGENDSIECDLTDWFQIGGRWFNSLTTKRNKGIKGELSYGKTKEEQKKLMKLNTKFDIANIKDIIMKFFYKPNKIIYKGKVYSYELDEDELNEVYERIKNRDITGVICAIDGHI